MSLQEDRWTPGATTLVASTTLIPGGVFKYDTSGGVIVQTLPQASTVPPGSSFWIKLLAGVNALTISPFAGDTIAGSTSSYFVQNISQSVRFVRDSLAGNWLIDGNGPLGYFDQYVIIDTNGLQSTNIAVNNHVEFKQLLNVRNFPSGLVTVTTGVGQANGIITLSGRRYFLWLWMRGNMNEGEIAANWTTGGGVVINEETGLPSREVRNSDLTVAGSDGSPTQLAFGIFDARAASITMELRFTTVSNPTNLESRVYAVPLA